MNQMNPSAEKAYLAIREKILSAAYPAGAILSTKHLAEEIGVSRTPVRDALRELETEGLVVLAPRQEARVKSATFEEFRDLCELRIALESHAAALAAERRSQDDLEAMQQALERMRSLVDDISNAGASEKKFGQMAVEDIRFHTAVIDAARNVLLRDEMLRFQVIAKVLNVGADGRGGLKINPYRNNPIDVWESHWRVYEAIRLQKREKAKSAMEEHLEEGVRAQLKARRESETHTLMQVYGQVRCGSGA
jgi:DNA-binding GntR family transcriptional regulator